MTDRRQELGRHYLQPGSPAYQAIERKIDQQGARVEEIFDRLEQRMDRIDRDVARSDRGQDRLANELVEVRRDIGELRDATHMAASKAVLVAADVAADTKPAVKSAVQEAVHELLRNPWIRTFLAVASVASAFTAIMVALNNIPDAQRGIERFLAYTRTADQPHGDEKKQGEPK